jgi:hypothetical protein
VDICSTFKPPPTVLLGGRSHLIGRTVWAVRLELYPFGIQVVVVELGAIKTPAVEKTLGDVEAVIRSLPRKGAARYGNMLRGFARRAYERETNGSSPDVVAQAIQHALTAKWARTRYRVGKHATLLATLATFLPDQLLDTIRFRITGMPTEFGSVPQVVEDRPIKRAA